jgi:hypothetical protein
MKFRLIAFLLVFCLLGLGVVSPQERVVIQVPVRALDGTMPPDLTMADFDLSEGGTPQNIQALYYIEKNQIVRREERKNFTLQPNATRHFYLVFQMLKYDSRLEDVMDDIFKNVIRPGDTLTLLTPLKVYALNQQALGGKPPAQISKEMRSFVRKDIEMGGSEYNSIIKDLRRLIKAIQTAAGIAGDQSQLEPEVDSDPTVGNLGLENTLDRYRTSLEKLEELRFVDSQKFIGFAEGLRKVNGQKIVFFFYQREFRPEINSSVLNSMMSIYQDDQNIQADLMELFQVYNRQTPIDAERISQAFADADICLHFLFMEMAAQYIFGTSMKEQSEDVFKAFKQISQATGGIFSTAIDPLAGFKSAAQASANYYLLCYTPAMYVPDGQFKTVQVGVKNRDLKLGSRLGYFSR